MKTGYGFYENRFKPAVYNPNTADTQPLPSLQVISSPVAAPALPDAVDSDSVQALGTKCGIRTPRGFTQAGYRKIASIFTKDETEYFVLTHEYLGGKLYRLPADVRLQDNKVAGTLRKAS